MPTTRTEVGIRLLLQVCAIIPVALGAFILGGGPDRFSGPSYRVPSELSPWWGWALVFTALGMGLAFNAMRFNEHAVYWCAGVAFVYLFFAAGFAFSILTEPDVAPGVPKAATTGIVVYTGLAALTLGTGMIACWKTVDRWVARLSSSRRRT